VLEDPEVSTSHCQIQQIGVDFHIFDLNSTNGTFLNGQRIVKAKLSPGDRIKVGKAEFLFDLERGASQHAGETVVFDPNDLPVPNDPTAKAIDDLLGAERDRFVRSMRILIDVTYGDGTKEQLKITGNEFVVGRLTQLGRFNRDEELSRRHVRFSLDDAGRVWAEDLGSTNGVQLNRAKIAVKTKLGPDDVVKVGKCRIRADVVPGEEYGLV
jgi:pSer/pThr/pTyr-binding forkhead associated (FHA) protein